MFFLLGSNEIFNELTWHTKRFTERQCTSKKKQNQFHVIFVKKKRCRIWSTATSNWNMFSSFWLHPEKKKRKTTRPVIENEKVNFCNETYNLLQAINQFLNSITRWVILDLERWWQNENNLSSRTQITSTEKAEVDDMRSLTFLNKRIQVKQKFLIGSANWDNNLREILHHTGFPVTYNHFRMNNFQFWDFNYFYVIKYKY